MATKRFNRLDKQHRTLAYEACEFVVDKLMPRLKHKLEIRFQGDPELTEREGIHGDCVYTEWTPGPPRDFVIRIDTSLDPLEFLTCVMHEMVHVKQWARNEMRLYERGPFGMVRWHKEKIDEKNLDYYDLPWEIEAHGREQGLCVQFLTTREDIQTLINEMIEAI